MHDGLEVQLEFVVAQGALQLLQPMDLAAVARVRLLARGIHVHVHAALLLGDVARRIGRVHEVLDRAAAAADLDETDAHADVEDLVLPDEAVIVDRTHHVVRDLPRLLERAPHQQQREFIAADASRRVRIAHRLLDDRGDLAQHIVAGGMPAGVVHHLEPVEIQVAQGVRRIARLSGVHRLAQPPFELAPIHETRQRIVTRLIGHLPGQAAQFAGVVHDEHEAERLLGVRLERRHADLHRAFRRGVGRNQHGAPAHGDPASRATGPCATGSPSERRSDSSTSEATSAKDLPTT